jgi:hypothetical protein
MDKANVSCRLVDLLMEKRRFGIKRWESQKSAGGEGFKVESRRSLLHRGEKVGGRRGNK